MLKNKKGQTGTLQTLAISLLVIGIVLGMGILLVREMGDLMTDTSATVNNETINPTNGTLVWLAYNSSVVGCWQDFSVSEITNTTDAYVINTANYTTDWRGGITATATSEMTDDSYSNMEWNVTYTYRYDDSAECIGIEDTITSVATIPGWLIIIVIMAIVGILLAMVFKYLPRGAGGGVAEI